MFTKKPMISKKDVLLLYEQSWNNAFSKTGRVPKVIITSSNLKDELQRECENLSMMPINGPQGYNTKLLWKGCQVISIDDVMCIFEELEE